mmetsp:Transcript_15232/g.47202  ORF Transcript_15232/g.47202 Transcript_15232/m.47202 type:complete len:276 (-) Transcript_15232:218-1045(-)
MPQVVSGDTKRAPGSETTNAAPTSTAATCSPLRVGGGVASTVRSRTAAASAFITFAPQVWRTTPALRLPKVLATTPLKFGASAVEAFSTGSAFTVVAARRSALRRSVGSGPLSQCTGTWIFTSTSARACGKLSSGMSMPFPTARWRRIAKSRSVTSSAVGEARSSAELTVSAEATRTSAATAATAKTAREHIEVGEARARWTSIHSVAAAVASLGTSRQAGNAWLSSVTVAPRGALKSTSWQAPLDRRSTRDETPDDGGPVLATTRTGRWTLRNV